MYVSELRKQLNHVIEQGKPKPKPCVRSTKISHEPGFSEGIILRADSYIGISSATYSSPPPPIEPTWLVAFLFNCRNIIQVRQVHTQLSVTGALSKIRRVSNNLIYVYARFKELDNARVVFDGMRKRDRVTWNVMVDGFAKGGDHLRCFETFRELVRDGVRPDTFNLPAVARACRDGKEVGMGRVVHCVVLKRGLVMDNFVCAALVDMYAKCGVLGDAKQLFDNMCDRDLVTWTVMVDGYAKCGCAKESMVLFDQMREEGVVLDKVAMLTVVTACAELGVMDRAKAVYDYMDTNSFSLDVVLGTATIDMFAKCGSIDCARAIFDRMEEKNVFSWSAMIAAYGYHGRGQEALDLFSSIVNSGIQPNRVTFLSLLHACSHSGLVDEGVQLFSAMLDSYGVKPDAKHYTSMVDMLGRSGKMSEASRLMEDPSVVAKNDEGLWRAFLGACRKHKRADLAEKAAESLLELQPQDPGSYVILSNIYANAGRWKDVAKVRDLMTKRNVKKVPGYTWIEVNNVLYQFQVGDSNHPQAKKIYAKLKSLRKQLVLAGYIPDTDFVLHDVEEEAKVGLLFTHSEKLAIAFGLIATPKGMPIRVMKNLQVCGDCHTFSKLVSAITNREIIVRDANRFHYIKNGSCSCGDYW